MSVVTPPCEDVDLWIRWGLLRLAAPARSVLRLNDRVLEGPLPPAAHRRAAIELEVRPSTARASRPV